MTTIKRSAPSTKSAKSAAPAPAPKTKSAEALKAAAGWAPKSGVKALAQNVSASLFPVSAKDVEKARASGDPKKMAEALHGIAKDRTGVVLHNDSTRIDRAKQLFDGLSVEQSTAVRQAYIQKYGMDPEHHIKSDDWGQPLARLPRDVETELLGAVNGAQLKKDAATLSGLLDKAKKGTLTQADRQEYFNLLPRQGLWDGAVRQTAKTGNLDSQERTLLSREFSAQGKGGLDAALKTIEAAMPPADLTPKVPREKNIAAIASSHGAQWQELMGWAQKMTDAGYHVQVFTPEGRPLAIQRDSLLVSTHTSGFGAPKDLDPNGRTGAIAREILGNAAPASKFDPKDFGAVYLAGGLGFNEDVAVAQPLGRNGSKLTANPNIESMMDKAIAERLPVIGLCHGPTLLAAVNIEVNGKKEPLNKGLETASLPPFEGYVGATGRKEIQFTHDVNTHRAMEAAGGQTHVLKDIADMSRVVKQEKDGMQIITGPGPQAAANLADATIEALRKKWN